MSENTDNMIIEENNTDPVSNEMVNEVSGPSEELPEGDKGDNGNEGDGKKKKKMSLIKKILIALLILILIAAAAAGIAFLVITNKGKASLYAAVEDNESMKAAKSVDYNGKKYEYNDKLINILAMGIDNKHTIPYIRKNVNKSKYQSREYGGQADALFLITIDTENKKVTVMPINRNSMTEIEYYDQAEEAFFTAEGQICLQHASSTGLEDGCELQVRATSKMLYNLPINGYISINREAIKSINKVVGGVEVEVLEDIPPVAHKNYDYGIGDSLTGVVGQKITLNNKQAYAYIRYRDVNAEDSNEKRTARQKQYIKALVKKMKELTKKNILFPFKVKDALSKYMVTDIDFDELVFLGTSVMGYSMDLDKMEGLPGKLESVKRVLNDDYLLEYHLDQDALREMLLKKFYKEVG